MGHLRLVEKGENMARHNPPRSSYYMGMEDHPNIAQDGSWLEPESLTYPSGGFKRRAMAWVMPNEYHPIPDLPYGELHIVSCSIPDTYFSIPAKLKYRGKVYVGYLSQLPMVAGDYTTSKRLTFTPQGD